MIELFRIIRRFVFYVLALIYIPLFFFAQAQSMFAIYEQQGVEAINPPRVWFVTKNNARLIWLKTIGVFPRITLLPTLGESYVVDGVASSQKKWGGCQVNLSKDSDAQYGVALGVAKCSDFQEQKISENFAGMSPAQLGQAYFMMEKTKSFRSGMIVYIQIAYSILAFADEVGPVSVSQYLDRQCAKAMRGGPSERHFCLVAFEVEEVLNRADVSSESERKAVAVKAGMQAWLWMISDAPLSKVFWQEWTGSHPDASANSLLRSWKETYFSYKESKPYLVLLRRNWGANDYEAVNSILKKNQMKPIDERIWAEEFARKYVEGNITWAKPAN